MLKIGLNEQIAKHAQDSAGWRHHKRAEKVYPLLATINKVCFGDELPQCVVGFDDVGRLKKAGDYHWEGDGMSLKMHIDLRKDLTDLELVLALLHNLTHVQVEIFKDKATWYHSKDFRDRMLEFGVKVDKSGDVTEVHLATFSAVLTNVGREDLLEELKTWEATEAELVTEPDPVDPIPKVAGKGEAQPETVKVSKAPSKGTSKMKKWTCGCTIVRCATELKATCLLCNQMFMKDD